MASFDIAVALVLAHEGGLVTLPGDPGGTTNFGIDQRSHPTVDVAALTREQAIAIYHDEYWMSWMDVEDQHLANCLLDCAVNQGVSTAYNIFTRARTLRQFQVERLMHYALLYKPQFLHSWISRTLDV